MTTNQLRQKVVDVAVSMIGSAEGTQRHRDIIDYYNNNPPLARSYKMKYTDAWCACYVSVVFMKAGLLPGLVGAIPKEVGCGKMIEGFQKMGKQFWQENEKEPLPQPGDIVMYDWDDGANYATTDNMGAPEHVGICVAIDGNTIRVIEGNYGNTVKYRNVPVNGRYLRGYGKPDWAKYAVESQEDEEVAQIKYNKVEECPEWARPTVKKLVDAKILNGVDSAGHLSLDDNLIRMLVINDRAGLYKNL